MESLTHSFKAQLQNKPSDSGTIKKWACAKRTGLLKKRSRREGLQDLGYNFTQKMPVESDQSSPGDSYVERRCIQKTPNPYESPLSSPDSSKRMDNLSFGDATNECNGQPSVRKRVGITSFGSRISGKMGKHGEAPKRNVRQLRKGGASMEGNCKDFATHGEDCIASLGEEPVELNACPVKNSSHDVCLNLSQNHCKFSSKATKFSSLRKHLFSVNQSSLPGSKYSVNRKFTSRKKSRSLCMAELDKKVVALDLKEKHAENQSRIEEITGRVSLSRSSVLKVRKKRGAFSISQEQSMAMKSASEECHSHEVGDDIDSSTRVGGDLENTFNDVESGRKEIQANRDNIVMRPCSGMDTGGNVVSSSKSLGPEFDNLANHSNALAGSFQLVEFKRSLSGAGTTPSCPTDSSLGDDEQDAFCMDEVGNRMIAQDTDMGEETDANDGQGNYFTGLDPIPIPGPPGSFLPSPGGMGSEDIQGTSSLTTSRVHSSEDQHDLVERDSSDSPISATSTVSNSMIARSDTKSSEKLAVGPHVTKDEIRSGFSGASHDAAKNVVPASRTVTTQAERINLDELKVKEILPEKGPISFRNDQPCCCSLKEGISQDISLNSQESQLLRRRTMVLPVLPMRKELSCDPSRRPNCWNSMPEVFPLGNFRSSGSEKRVLPVMNLSSAPVSVEVSAHSMLKSPSYGDYDSASPSASNPVLRLMGKNLMVVSKDENVTQQFRPAQSGSLNDHPYPQLQAVSEVSPGNIQDEKVHSFHHMGLQHPQISSQNQCNKGFEVKLSNCFGSHVASKTRQSSASCASSSSSGMFLSKNVGGGYYIPPFEPLKYDIRYSLPNDRDRARRNKSYTPFLYNVEKGTTSGTQRKNDPAKEVIVIDDTPERETDSAPDALYSDGTRETRVSSAGNSIPMAGSYSPRHASPFCSYHPVQDSFPYHGSSLLQTAGFQMPPHGINASPIKWNCTSDGSNVHPPTSVTGSLSSTGRPRSSLYYSPSFT